MKPKILSTLQNLEIETESHHLKAAKVYQVSKHRDLKADGIPVILTVSTTHGAIFVIDKLLFPAGVKPTDIEK